MRPKLAGPTTCESPVAVSSCRAVSFRGVPATSSLRSQPAYAAATSCSFGNECNRSRRAKRSVQQSANDSLDSNAFTRRARLSGRRSARNAATSDGSGNRPVRSRLTRLNQAASSAGGETGRRSIPSVRRISSSMKFARGSAVRSAAASDNGTRNWIGTTLSRNRAMTTC